jgi:hypothetical protein
VSMTAEQALELALMSAIRNFAATGDWMRNSRPALESVVNAGVRTIVLCVVHLTMLIRDADLLS